MYRVIVKEVNSPSSPLACQWKTDMLRVITQ